MDSLDWVVIGRFGKPHGIKGYITVISFTEPRDNILQYTNWHIRKGEQWLPLKMAHVEVNQKHVLALVDGYNEREQVAALTNCEIGVSREQLPKLAPGEYYWHQLYGMQVVTIDGTVLGEVTDILPTGANDVLVVQGERRHLIPYVLDTVVVHIDDALRKITVDWDVDF